MQPIVHTFVTFLCWNTGGILALLDEPQQELQVYALQSLNNLVNEFWAEISDSVAKM